MAYDQQAQYRAPPRPYMSQQAPPQVQKPPPQPYPQNQYNGYGQDGYYNEESRPYSYKGYDGDGFWEEYGYGEGAQGQYDPYQNAKPPSRQGNYGYGGGGPLPGQQYPQDQRYPPQGRARGYSNGMNGSMQNAQTGPPGTRRTPPQGYGPGAGPPPNRDYGQQQPGRPQNSPPRQRQGGDRPPLVKTTSPRTLGFDNPFPAFPGQIPKSRTDDEMVERAMEGLSMSGGRPSLDSQRPPTASSRTSKKSARSNESGQYNDPYYGAAPRPSGEHFRRPSQDDPAARGPPKRAMTMPEHNGNPVNSRQPNQAPNGMQGSGYGAAPPIPGYQDPTPQRSYSNRMEPGYGPTQRSFTAGGDRSQQPSGYNPNQFYGSRSGGQRAPPPAPSGPTNQYQYGNSQRGPTSPNNPRLRESQLDAYMPNFDDGQVENPPLQDPIGLPLDVAPGIQRPPTRSGAQTPGSRAPEVYQAPQGLQRSRSHPDLRDQGRIQAYQAGPDAPPMPRGPSPMAPAMNGQRGSPVYPNGGMNGPPQQQSQYAAQYAQPQVSYGGYGQGPPQSPRQFHRPGAPRMDTAQSAWSDPGPAQRMEARPPPVRPGQMGQQPPPSQAQQQQRNYNPDALPAHPAPVRPGLLQGTQASRPPPVRQYGSPAQQGQPPPDSGRSSMQEERRMSAPVTFEEISRLRQAAKNNPSDYKTQLTLAKKLVEASVSLSDEGGRADVKTRNKNRENYIFEATKMVRKLVGNGYPEAMFYLADCYGTGQLGFAVDPKEAFKLYQQAAKTGHAASAYRTAVCCEMGNEAGGGTSKDPLKAVQWYRRAATLGDVPAMYKLGMILLKGLLGQQAAMGEALIWLQRAAERADEDNPHALHELAVLYETAPNGGKIIRDEAYAYQLFEKASRWGYRLSQCRLGKAYEYGQLGCPIDNRSSIHWYSKAAAQEDHEAELALSGWYLTGSSGILDQSDTEAYLWARKAAMAEMPKAEFAMGYFSEVGIGCPRSLEDAKRWYGRAAAHKYPKAQERLEELKKGGPKAQMKGRERLSRSDRTKHNDDCVVM